MKEFLTSQSRPDKKRPVGGYVLLRGNRVGENDYDV